MPLRFVEGIKIVKKQNMNLKNEIDHRDEHFPEYLVFLEFHVSNKQKDTSMNSSTGSVKFSTHFYRQQIKLVVTENIEIE